MNAAEMTRFAQRYAAAWCSQDPEKVAAFYAKGGSISVNRAPPAPIAEVVNGFMRDFPDIIVTFDKLGPRGDRTEFHWTFTGTKHRPGWNGKQGSNQRLRIVDDQQ